MHGEQGLSFENPHLVYLYLNEVQVSGPTGLLCAPQQWCNRVPCTPATTCHSAFTAGPQWVLPTLDRNENSGTMGFSSPGTVWRVIGLLRRAVSPFIMPHHSCFLTFNQDWPEEGEREENRWERKGCDSGKRPQYEMARCQSRAKDLSEPPTPRDWPGWN